MGFDLQPLWNRRKEEAKLGLRGYGKKAVADALAEIDAALREIGGDAVHGNDEESGLLSLLNDVANVDQYDDSIRGERDAMDALENLAFAVGLAFDLGKYAGGGGVDLEELQRRRIACKKGGQNSGRKKAEAWKAVAREIWANERERLTDPAIAKKIWAELANRKMLVAEKTILNEIKKLKKLPTSRLLGTH
jgi:hypothetical protein